MSSNAARREALAVRSSCNTHVLRVNGIPYPPSQVAWDSKAAALWTRNHITIPCLAELEQLPAAGNLTRTFCGKQFHVIFTNSYSKDLVDEVASSLSLCHINVHAT